MPSRPRDHPRSRRRSARTHFPAAVAERSSATRSDSAGTSPALSRPSPGTSPWALRAAGTSHGPRGWHLSGCTSRRVVQRPDPARPATVYQEGGTSRARTSRAREPEPAPREPRTSPRAHLATDDGVSRGRYPGDQEGGTSRSRTSPPAPRAAAGRPAAPRAGPAGRGQHRLKLYQEGGTSRRTYQEGGTSCGGESVLRRGERERQIHRLSTLLLVVLHSNPPSPARIASRETRAKRVAPRTRPFASTS
jgi:hypothetical protein